MVYEDIEEWIDLLSQPERLTVFKHLSQYLSISELTAVMNGVAAGEDLLFLHRNLGLIKKYYVDIIRIRNVLL